MLNLYWRGNCQYTAIGFKANLFVRDCAIIIRRGGPKTRGGALHKIAAKIGGAQSKITHLTEGGP